MSDFTVSLTRTGRQIEAQQLVYGYAYEIQFFELGSGGHDPANPTVALPLNTDVTELPGVFFGPEPFDSAIMMTPTCSQFTCVAQQGDAVGGISNLGLIGVITYVPPGSPLGAPVKGSQFLHSLCNFALNYKVSSSRESFVVKIKT